jgi:putative DNA primase/helicase
MASGTIDPGVIARAKDSLVDTIGRFVEIKKRGNEYVACCPFHQERSPSFTVNPDKGFYYCFGCGATGDAVDFVMHHQGLGFREAVELIVGNLPAGPAPERSSPRPRAPERQVITPAPTPCPSFFHPAYGEPVHVWAYSDLQDRLLGYVARYEPAGERKQIVPWTFGGQPDQRPTWGMGQFTDPRPLYGLNTLPGAKAVLLVEGEKAADAARAFAGGVYAVMTWPGGSQAWRKVDWSPLHGQRILLWPDADEPGLECMRAIGRQLLPHCPEVKIIDPQGQPKGWDAADSGFDWQAFLAWAKPRVSLLPADEPPDDPAPPSPPPPPATPPPRARPALVVVGNTAAAAAPVAECDVIPEKFSEDNAALAFSKRHAEELRYVAGWGRWMKWDGARWTNEDTLEVFDLARVVCREFARDARTDGSLSDSQRSRVATVYGKSQTVTSVEKLAKADRRHAATTRQWDSDPWLLNTPAGVVDLRDGTLHPQRRDAYMTKITSVAPGGDCPTWRKFLDVATHGDTELQVFMQQLAGYSLTGITREQILAFVYGPGGNGKGTFINTLQWVMGDYATTAAMDLFTERKHEGHPTELAGLMGARLVTAQETEEGKRWAEARIKAMTGGDPIKARFMRQDEFEFIPQFKLLIAGNHKPGLRNVDEAIRRRLRLIPFDVMIPAEKRDQHLAEKLRGEGPGILQWAIDGCLDWQARGLLTPARVLAATEDYLEQQDSFGLWLEECTVRIPGATKRSSLYESFKAWADRSGEYQLPQKRWVAALEQRGFSTMTRKGYPVVEGVGLKEVQNAPYWPDERDY